MVINIGVAKSFKKPESWDISPDDRQAIVKTIGGVYIEDAGYFPAGDVASCQCVFNAANWDIIKSYWQNRTMVIVVDHAGNNLGLRRIKINKISYVEKFEKLYNVNIEFWGA